MLLQIATTILVFFSTLALVTVVLQQQLYIRAGATFLIGALLFLIPAFITLDLVISGILYFAGGGLIAYAVVGTVKRLRVKELRRLRAEIIAEQQQRPGPLQAFLGRLFRAVAPDPTGGKGLRTRPGTEGSWVPRRTDEDDGDAEDELSLAALPVRPSYPMLPPPRTDRPGAARLASSEELRSWAGRGQHQEDRTWSAAARSLFKASGRQPGPEPVSLLQERNRIKAAGAAATPAAATIAAKRAAPSARPDKAAAADRSLPGPPARRSTYLARLARRR